MRHFHTSTARMPGALGKLLGVGLAASMGLTALGAAATPSFAATSSLPDVIPVICPAGMTCSTPPTDTGTTPKADKHCKVDKHAPKGKAKADKKCKADKPAPKAKGQLKDFLESSSVGNVGVKWH